MFNLQVSTTNAAFEDDFAEEIVRILTNVAERVRAGQTSGRIHDLNGSSVGTFSLEETS